MTISDMLGQSLILTLLGMGVVFVFLIILIGAMNLLHKVLSALHLDKDEPKNNSAVSVAAAPVADTNAVIAAIAAAVHEKQLN